MTETLSPPAPSAKPRLGQLEFIAMTGTLFASVAFSIDAMLPALPEIAQTLTPDAPNRAQMIITAFVLGMGAGTLLAGPLSDRFGRKAIIAAGALLYILGALIAWAGPTLEAVLLGRVLQGLDVAGPRIVAMAIVRDLYDGRQMARIVSFAMMVFTLFPAVAPLIGAGIIAGFGWRAIFLAFVLFSALSVGWLLIRQEETLPLDRRRPLTLTPIRAAIVEVLSHRTIVFSIGTQTLIFGMLFAVIASVQPVFDIQFGMADSFPVWFGALALVAAIPSLINASIVVRFGMRRLVRMALVTAAILTVLTLGAMLLLDLSQGALFWVYYLWTVSLFGMMGFTLGNLNALAMQPVGHIAGTAASVIGAISTIGGGLLGAPLGMLFDGTALPLVFGVLVFTIAAVAMFSQVDTDKPLA